ncbi:MAG TPA: ATP-binding protein [Allosphingosinicella sp.]|nr:ATP-binding protein [Allosphingosinicella sp.]
MNRLLPKSLIGQIALLMAIALLIAQAINFSLVFSERQRATRAQVEGPAVSRFVTIAQRIAPVDPEQREGLLPLRGRRTRYSLDTDSVLDPGRSEGRIAQRLRETAAENGLVLRDARGAVSADVLPPRRRDHGRPLQMLLMSAQFADGTWLNARMVTQRPNPWLAARAAGSTLLIYLIVLGAMIWMATRLARPLRDLTLAAERFQGRGEAPRVEPRGPADVKRAIEAFNAMSGRVGAMLDEKDRMLGAIGHDLRTPLASLRIRTESVEPEEERQKMIRTIEEMTTMLDNTLALARSGRSMEPARSVDLTALVDSIVEEFRDLGHDVEMEPGGRVTASIQTALLRPAIRNLIENAVKYGSSARAAVRASEKHVAIEISDQGPGIPESELAQVQLPFVRLESSRSRETGGSGLGLTLARAAAQAHNGSLVLENQAQGGLIARILLPRENVGI